MANLHPARLHQDCDQAMSDSMGEREDRIMEESDVGVDEMKNLEDDHIEFRDESEEKDIVTREK